MQDAIILYENGKAIGGEGHPTDAGDITFDNTGTDLVSENVEGAIVEVNSKTSGLTRMTKLWENPSPTASFSAQNITLSSDDYDFLMVDTAIGYGTPSQYNSFITKKGKTVCLNFSSGAASQTRSRDLTYVNDTTLHAESCYVNGSANNSYVVPQTIYGIKLI